MSSSLKLGLALETFVPQDVELEFANIVRYAQRAEELGFSSLYGWDHLFLGTRTYFPLYEVMTTMAALATATERVELGTGVLVLPLRDPTTLAKMITTIDHASGGRFVLGTAAGWYEKEYEALGVPHKKRGRIFERNLEILLALLTEKMVTINAPGFGEDAPPLELRRVVTEPKTIASPRPPILLGGYVDRVFKRIAKYADGWLGYLYTPEEFSKAWTRVCELTEEEGRDPAELRNVTQLPICVNDSFEEADRRVREFGSRYLDLPEWSQASLESGIRGSVDDCLEQIAAQAAQGAQEVVLMPVDYEQEQVEIVAREILPKVDGITVATR